MCLIVDGVVSLISILLDIVKKCCVEVLELQVKFSLLSSRFDVKKIILKSQNQTGAKESF